METNQYIVISFVIYLLFMLGIGWYFYYRTKNLSDYVLAGRGLNSWVTALSAQASDMSGWLLMGLPGVAYLSGLEAGWIALGLGMGTWLNWKFVARRLRVYTSRQKNALTLPQFFENRFNDTSHLLRIISSVFILIFFLIYTSSGFVAGAKLFTAIFQVNYTTALLISVVVIISYTFLGGFHAVSWTDFIQGLLMFVAVLVVPFLGITRSGGITQTIDNLRAVSDGMLNPFLNMNEEPVSLLVVISSLAWGLGYFGQPHILARFMAIKKSRNLKFAMRIAMVWVVISLSAATIIGMVGRQYFSIALEDSEQVFIALIHSYIPPILSGIFLSAILAAIMSTADSQLLVTSSSLTEDLFQFIVKRKISDMAKVWISRFGVILVAIFAFFIALNPDAMVLDLVAYAWAGFGASFGPAILFTLYSKTVSRQAVLTGMITGGITALIWKQLEGGIFVL